MKRWTVDPATDANGHWTIRIDDGSDHGDTEQQPIATVFVREDAVLIVGLHNYGSIKV